MPPTPIGFLAEPTNLVRYDAASHAVDVLDMRRYPFERARLRYDSVGEIVEGIERLVVRGGPAVAWLAAFGLALAAEQSAGRHVAEQRAAIEAAARRLVQIRPTADDLHALLAAALAAALEAIDMEEAPATAIRTLVAAAMARHSAVSAACGAAMAALLAPGERVLTHGYGGAALNHMLAASIASGREIELIITETRPHFQGAQLGASQGVEIGVPVTVIGDGMVATLMREGRVDRLVTAADRIALDGAVAGKVGSYGCAIAARFHGLPHHVLGYDGPDRASATASDIPIEERPSRELLFLGAERLAAPGVQARYPAFDITPPALISAIVTDHGVFAPAAIGRYGGTRG